VKHANDSNTGAAGCCDVRDGSARLLGIVVTKRKLEERNLMRRSAIFVLGSAVAASIVAGLGAAAPGSSADRGKYLVEHVAMCVDCHSPRSEKGEFDQARWLGGSKLDFQPSHPMPVWADYAPPLAGLPGWKDEQVIQLLRTGLTHAGKPARPPMPSYRMTHEDASAVVAYLRSLNLRK
jgi:mono/diheme cytochrome c family protein